jgi:release factor glutamine methyltransferase
VRHGAEVVRREAVALPSPAGGGAGGEGEAGKVRLVGALLQEASSRLEKVLHLDRREARLEARILAARALNVNRAWLVAHDRDELSPAQASAIEALVSRREQGEPVAYILGEKEFYGRLFKVTPDVLIPRPETELLVEAALERLPKDRPVRILDLGTGSGCIAITLALERADCAVTAADASPDALAVAQENARRLGAKNVEWLQTNWYEGLGIRKFDVIVSNPPYIADLDPHLNEGDLPFEPHSALASGPDGLDAIRAIIVQATEHLVPSGWLMLEHGFNQSEGCRSLLAHAGLTSIASLSDLADITRISLGQCNPALK